MRRTLLLFLLLAPGLMAQSWYNASWVYRAKVTVDHTKVAGASALTNFPVLVSVTDANLAVYALANANDVLFTSSDGTTKLDHEIEKYTSATGAIVAWVRVPSLSPTVDTVLYMYYGNSGAANQQNPTGVWDNNYKGVWHMGDGVTLTTTDSTTNANNGTPTATSPTAAAGKVGGAASFDGNTGRYIDIGSSTSLGGLSAYTFEAWVKPTAFGDDGYSTILGADKTRPSATDPYQDALFIIGDAKAFIAVSNGTSGSRVSYNPTFGMPYTTGSWQHVAGVYDGSTLQLWWNGALVGTSAVAARTTPATPDTSYRIGQQGLTGSMEQTNGLMDEVRFSNVARSQPWMLTEYVNMSSPSTFLSVGAQETGPVVLVSSPAGVPILADGSPCTSPCVLNWAAGSTHTIAATQQIVAGTRYTFASWSDAGAASHSITVPAGQPTYTATFTSEYLLTTQAAGVGTVTAGGWHNSGDVVSISAIAGTGATFAGFGGALKGTTTPQNVTITGPTTVSALFSSTALKIPPSGLWTMGFDSFNLAAAVSNVVLPFKLSSPLLKSFATPPGLMFDSACGDVALWANAAHTTPLTWKLTYCDTVNGEVGGYFLAPTIQYAVVTGGLTVAPANTWYVTFGNGPQTGSTSGSGATLFGYESDGGVWTFDSTTAPGTDETGNGNTAILAGCTQVAGYVGKGISCSNTAYQYASVPDAASLKPANFTVALRYYLRSQGGSSHIIAAKNNSWSINGNYLGASKIAVTLTAGGSQITCATTNVLATGAWYQIVMTYDGANVKVFVDPGGSGIPGGSAGASCAKTGAVNYTGSDLAMYFGGEPGLTYCDCIIDDVHLSSTVWSDDVIQTYLMGVAQITPPQDLRYRSEFGSVNNPGNISNGDTYIQAPPDYVTSNDGNGMPPSACGVNGANVFFGKWTTKYSALTTINCMTSFGVGNATPSGYGGGTVKTAGITTINGCLVWAVFRQHAGGSGPGNWNGYYAYTGSAFMQRSCDGGVTWCNALHSGGPSSCSSSNADGDLPALNTTLVFSNFTSGHCVRPFFIEGNGSSLDAMNSYKYAFCSDESYNIVRLIRCANSVDCLQANWQMYTGPIGGDPTNAAYWSTSDVNGTIFENQVGLMRGTGLLQVGYKSPFGIVGTSVYKSTNSASVVRADHITGPYQVVGEIPYDENWQQGWPSFDWGGWNGNLGTIVYGGDFSTNYYHIFSIPVRIIAAPTKHH